MMKKIYNKLVRNYIPEIIEKDNKLFKMRILNNDEYIIELKKKLIEEAYEVNEAMTKHDISEELADVIEIIEALKDIYNIKDNEIRSIKDKKGKINGKFEDKIFLEYVIEDEI